MVGDGVLHRAGWRLHVVAGGAVRSARSTDGRIGTIHGSVDFLPGVGVRLDGNNAYIDYPLPTTITDGEISAVVTNLCSCSGQPGIKTRVFSMSQGYDNLTDNDRRFTVEKRSGADKGVVAWRFITRQRPDRHRRRRARVRPVRPGRQLPVARDPTEQRRFNLTIDELGGGRVYEFGKHYDGVYNPTPHVVVPRVAAVDQRS